MTPPATDRNGARMRRGLDELGRQIMITRSGLGGALFNVVIPKE